MTTTILKNGLELVTSEARKEDAKEIIEYLNIIGGESDNLLFGANGFKKSLEDEEIFLENLHNAENNFMLCGRINGELASIVSIQSIPRERIKHVCDIAVSVKKKFWHMGVGTKMMSEVIEFARQTNVLEIIHLGVKSDNLNAMKLYEKMGFMRIGIYTNGMKVNGKYYDEVLMEMIL